MISALADSVTLCAKAAASYIKRAHFLAIRIARKYTFKKMNDSIFTQPRVFAVISRNLACFPRSLTTLMRPSPPHRRAYSFTLISTHLMALLKCLASR